MRIKKTNKNLIKAFEALKYKDTLAQKLIADAAEAIKQLSTIKINLTINGKEAADIKGTCTGTKEILIAMKDFVDSSWIDYLPKKNLFKNIKKMKGKNNV